VDAVIESVVLHEASGSWAELATDEALQRELIDDQLKFVKNGAEWHRYHANQLFDEVEVVSATRDGDVVTIAYRAIFDMLAPLARDAQPPSVEEIDPQRFTVSLPLDPVAAYRDSAGGCATDSRASGYNFYYYFRPWLETCEIALVEAEIAITEVHPRPTVYPEYDRLMREMGDGSVGFRAALVPAFGDARPSGRFDRHREMLENDLGLTGVEVEPGVHRFDWAEDGVTIRIDLFDPTENDYDATFRQALGDYQLVFYNGHSAYGTRRFLLDEEAYDDDYQIVMLHSCRSYAYYVQQAFRAKATDDDPQGFAAVDFVATGRSSYARDSPKTLRALLTGLMDGMRAIATGREAEATDWLSITTVMNTQVAGILYGVAGVRENTWQPATP
jgi:hypothetical protein